MTDKLDGMVRLPRFTRMTLPEDHPDAVWIPDRGWMESDAVFVQRIKEAGLDRPRYSFGDVQGAMKDGIAVSIGFDECNRVNIEFTYTDRLDGFTYTVSASGYRTKIDKEAPHDGTH